MGDDRFDCGEKECMKECQERCFRECVCNEECGNSGFIWILLIILILCFCSGNGKGGLFSGLF